MMEKAVRKNHPLLVVVLAALLVAVLWYCLSIRKASPPLYGSMIMTAAATGIALIHNPCDEVRARL
jgi:hypothetical protein